VSSVVFDGTRLRAERRLAALSQDELCRLAGISRNELYRLEYGLSQPWPATVRALARALGVRPRDLFTEKTEDVQPVA
jgi:transcriptional regulator with XRE-family HTH domain